MYCCVRLLALMIGILATVTAPAAAQYFGRNKVQYGTQEFQVLKTEHFDIYHYGSEHATAVQAGRLAERWYERLSRALDHTFRERQPIVLYASHAQFAETTVVPVFIGEGVGGLTEHLKGRIVLPFTASLGETDHVLGHELVHAFQRDILQRLGRSMAMLPLWYIEGMAEYLSVGRIDSLTAMWLRDAVARDKLPSIDQLSDPQWFPYRYGQALWVFVTERFGDQVVGATLRSRTSNAVGRVTTATGLSSDDLTAAWHEELKTRFAPTPAVEPAPSGMPQLVIGREKNGGRLNVGPALSPDGRQVVFLSERDRYSIDVFLADAATGEIQRTLVGTAADPHFDSLEFIQSAGAWDPAGGRFAFSALSRGRPVLTVVETATGAVLSELRFEQLDQIFTPTWSPDGRRVAFAAMNGGVSDLYVVDLSSGELQRLTDDPYADLQPAWSPDGRTIAFSTDRFSSTLDQLTFGPLRLAGFDTASAAIEPLPSIHGAKNINPQWSPDGQRVYFISDAGGTNNVMALDLGTRRLSQITHVSTGVSGIAATSPSLSVARGSGDLAFSMYRGGDYEIYRVAPPESLPAVSAERPLASASTIAAAPPGDAPARPASFALADPNTFTLAPYQPTLSLRGIGRPYLSMGGGGGSGFFRAGAAFAFSDMLGQRNLDLAVQVGTRASDLAAQTTFTSQASRWNWGVTAEQVPWLVGDRRRPSLVESGGQYTSTSVVFRQTHRQLAAFASYPFSRSQRIEVSGGFHAIGFDRLTTVATYDGVTSRRGDPVTTVGDAGPGLLLGEAGVALTYDTALHGPTSPVLGTRYRFAVSPTFGHLNLATVTADYRRYFMPVRPFTIATRVEHVGRYGPGAWDPRLLPLARTLRDLVRGFGDLGRATTGADLIDSRRIVVANAELRFPLLQTLGRATAGPIPIEAVAFGDAGAFWTAGENGTIRRTMIRSVGAGIRFNAAGMLFEVDAVRPLAVVNRGWSTTFNFRRGF